MLRVLKTVFTISHGPRAGVEFQTLFIKFLHRLGEKIEFKHSEIQHKLSLRTFKMDSSQVKPIDLLHRFLAAVRKLFFSFFPQSLRFYF